MNAAGRLVEVRVPDLGNFKDVAVIDVLVKPGDSIAIDTPLVTLESDKAAMDVPSTASGVVETVHATRGGKVPRLLMPCGCHIFARGPVAARLPALF